MKTTPGGTRSLSHPQSGPKPKRTLYARDRPTVMIGRHEDYKKGQLEAHSRAMMCTKYISWKYEKEWRLIRPLDRADRTLNAKDGSLIHLFCFPSDAVLEVVVGARMTDADRNRLMNALATGELTDIRLRGAQRSTTSFLLEIADL